MAEITEANPQQDTPNTEAPANAPTPELEKFIEKREQAAGDRVRTEYSQRLKAAYDELETLRMEKMTAKERSDHETNKLKSELEEKARILNRRSLELLATQELEKEGLDIGFLDAVIGSDEDATKGKISTLKKTFNEALGKAVKDAMKAQGRDPNKGRDGTVAPNGFAGMTPKEIQSKARSDPAWFTANEKTILEAMAAGQFKR